MPGTPDGAVPAKQWAVQGVLDHPLRETLNNELHARPATVLMAPARVSHLALMTGHTGADRDRSHVVELCRRFDAAEPRDGATFWSVDLGMVRLNWERHTEFSTYTFYREESFVEPFRETAIAHLPADWLANLAGEVMVAAHVALEPREGAPREGEPLTGLFASATIAGSEVFDGAALVWTDFRLQGDGFTRILLRDVSLGPNRTGRLVQRLLELDTYRMMALLSFPLAKAHADEVTRADRTLAALTRRMTRLEGLAAERDLLSELSGLAAEIERIAAATNYRFRASRAYYALVQRRLEELRERRLGGRQTIGELMERRLAPAMRTCESMAEQLEVLSERVARAGDLLRTRVDLALESQNQTLLRSMERRARLQVRLQETVEGLSVVVLSYYTVGLAGYGFKAAKAAGLAIDTDLATGLSVPVVVGMVWLGVRRLRRALMRKAD
jgi:uncharacterized membrane-anchored protein